jgi:hypothetical protein
MGCSPNKLSAAMPKKDAFVGVFAQVMDKDISVGERDLFNTGTPGS